MTLSTGIIDLWLVQESNKSLSLRGLIAGAVGTLLHEPFSCTVVGQSSTVSADLILVQTGDQEASLLADIWQQRRLTVFRQSAQAPNLLLPRRSQRLRSVHLQRMFMQCVWTSCPPGRVHEILSLWNSWWAKLVLMETSKKMEPIEMHMCRYYL